MAQIKWASAEAKAQAIKLEQDWQKLQQAHASKSAPAKRNLKKAPRMPVNPRIAELRAVKSVDSGVTGAVTCGTETKVYTGDKIVGIATMHKSNLVPIFSDEAAKDVSSMRR
jgi:sRNA-binding protein